MKILTITSPDFAEFTAAALPFLPGAEVVEVNQPPDNTFGQVGFNRVCFEKARQILAMLLSMDEGEWLLYTDADVIFFRPAAEIVAKAKEIVNNGTVDKLPLVAQEDPDTGPCAGFLVMENTPMIRELWRRVWEYRNDGYNDQNALCAMARHLTFLFSRDFIASWGNQHVVGGVWKPEDPRKITVPKGCAAWHLNYVVGVGHKRALAAKVMAAANAVLT